MKQAAKGSLQLAINSSERPLQEIMVKLLNKIQPQVNACYTSEYGRTLIKQKSDADEIRKAALDTYLSQEAKLESNGAGSTKPDIELSKRVCRAILKMIKCYESSQSKDDDKDTTYVPDVESEADGDTTPEGDEDVEEVADSGDELFDTIDLGWSLEKTHDIEIQHARVLEGICRPPLAR